MYQLLKVPTFANKDFFSFTKEEAKEYLKWFMEIRFDRLQVLETTIRKSYPDWKADYTKASFVDLDKWFRANLSYRPMTEVEKDSVRQQIQATPLLINVVSIPEMTFSDETVSICFDTGLYFGESLIFNVAGVKWLQKTTSSSYIDYAQPLIAKQNSKVPINPRRIAESISQSILDKDDKQFTFADLFDKWVLKFSKSE